MCASHNNKEAQQNQEHSPKISNETMKAISRILPEELVKKGIFEVPLKYDEDEFSFRNSKRGTVKITGRAEPLSPLEIKHIQDDCNSSIEPLRRFINNQLDHKWRGFNADFLLKYGCRFIEEWTHPKNRNTGKKERIPTRRMIIPAGRISYLARLVDSVTNYSNSYQKINDKIYVGKKALFNPEVLNSKEPIFCFEGFLDAMSAEFAGFKALATGSYHEGNLLINAVKKLKRKPQIILVFDDTADSREVGYELQKKLLQLKCPSVMRFLEKATKEYKNNANYILQNQGVEVLHTILQDIVNSSLTDLNAFEAEFTKKDAVGLTDEDWDFIFSGDVSDLSFARRLERFCCGRVKWLKDKECWLTFNGSVWEFGSEKNVCIFPFARELAETMAKNAEKKDEKTIADKLRSVKKISASISLLKSFDSILIDTKALNCHNELFCVQNGVINLKTGELYPHDPKYLITQQSPAVYRKGYRSPVVDNFLMSILPDKETRDALVRYLGYAATGEVVEEKALFAFGPGGNGKGTLTRTVLVLFGDYGTALRPSAVLSTGKSQDAGAATTELNPLEGCRLAVIEELPQGGHLDVAKFKNLTGGDRVPIRKLHCEQTYIDPHFSLILSGNYRPELGDIHDPGLLRRLLNIDFTQSFVGEARDPYLKKKLTEPDALSGFLSIVVSAAQDWYRNGLAESAAMQRSTCSYLNTNDFIGEFIAEHCEYKPNLSVTRKSLLELLKKEYPDECFKLFKNRDRALVEAIKRIDGISYDCRSGVYRFRGIGWRNI